MDVILQPFCYLKGIISEKGNIPGRKRTETMKIKVKELLTEYKLTLTVLVLWTLLGSFLQIVKEILAALGKEEWFDLFEKCLPGKNTDIIFLFLILFGLGCLLAEIRYKGQWKQKLAVVIPSGFLSFFLAYQVSSSSWKSNYNVAFMQNKISYDRAREWMAAYLILVLSAIVYSSFKRYGVNFSKYAMKLAVNISVVFGISFIVFFVGTIFILVVEALFENANVWTDTVMMVLLYLTGFCAMVGMIWFLKGGDEEERLVLPGNAWHILPAALIGAVTAGILAAGYVYGMKLLLFWQLPSNEVFEVVSWIFVLSMPAWIIGEGLDEESIYHKVSVKLPWVFAPLMLLQILSMGIRVYAYGLTQQRYLGIMLILFEVILLVLWKFGRAHMERLLIVLMCLTVISILVPGINMTSLSEYQQEKCLQKYSEMASAGEEMTETEYLRFQGAYEFITDQKGYAYMEENYQEAAAYVSEDYAAERGYIKEETDKKTWYGIHGCQMVGELDVTVFTTMNMVVTHEDYEDYENYINNYIDVDFAEFKFEIRETGEELVVDISKLYEEALQFIKENPDASQEEEIEFLKQHNKIELEDGSILYINHFEINWFLKTEEGKEVWKIGAGMNISGMLLQK